jgi:hypothetical protein
MVETEIGRRSDNSGSESGKFLNHLVATFIKFMFSLPACRTFAAFMRHSWDAASFLSLFLSTAAFLWAVYFNQRLPKLEVSSVLSETEP